MKPFLKIVYFLLAIAIGVGCFAAFIIVILSLNDGFLSHRNLPLAFSAAFIALFVVALFLTLGYLFFRNKNLVIGAFIVILLSALLTMPILLLSGI